MPPQRSPAAGVAVPRARATRALPLLIAVVAAAAIGLVASGQPGKLVEGGLTYVPFVVLSLLAYAGARHSWARVATVLWLLVVVVGGAVALGVGLTLGAAEHVAPDGLPEWLPLGFLGGVVLAVACYLPPVRHLAARLLPLDPRSFVHATALAAVVSLTWLSCVPLLALGQAPLLVRGVLDDLDLGQAASTREQLVELATALAWTIPSALVAVGYPLVRGLGAAIERLALVLPTRRQLALGVALAVVLAVAIDPFELLVSLLWQALGWPISPAESVERLFARNLNPVGAVVMGITAGLSEELLCRGVLQPRLGLLLPNLFFAALHAYQYNGDGLVVVFALGLVFGVLRQRTNTTVCALVHGLYDFLLVMMLVLDLPTLTGLLGLEGR
jgi:membrane protease YdiL (CAAX protease family)